MRVFLGIIAFFILYLYVPSRVVISGLYDYAILREIVEIDWIQENFSTSHAYLIENHWVFLTLWSTFSLLLAGWFIRKIMDMLGMIGNDPSVTDYIIFLTCLFFTNLVFHGVFIILIFPFSSLFYGFSTWSEWIATLGSFSALITVIIGITNLFKHSNRAENNN